MTTVEKVSNFSNFSKFKTLKWQKIIDENYR